MFLEAAATGKPSIGGRNGGVPEAVADGETGLLVEGTNSGELANAIRTLARSPTLRATMGAAGRRRVVQSLHGSEPLKRLRRSIAKLTVETRESELALPSVLPHASVLVWQKSVTADR